MYVRVCVSVACDVHPGGQGGGAQVSRGGAGVKSCVRLAWRQDLQGAIFLQDHSAITHTQQSD